MTLGITLKEIRTGWQSGKDKGRGGWAGGCGVAEAGHVGMSGSRVSTAGEQWMNIRHEYMGVADHAV